MPICQFLSARPACKQDVELPDSGRVWHSAAYCPIEEHPDRPLPMQQIRDNGYCRLMKPTFASFSCSQHLRDSLSTGKSFILFSVGSAVQQSPRLWIPPRDYTTNHSHGPDQLWAPRFRDRGVTCMAAVDLVLCDSLWPSRQFAFDCRQRDSSLSPWRGRLSDTLMVGILVISELVARYIACWARQPLKRDDRVHAMTLTLSCRHSQMQANLDHFRVPHPPGSSRAHHSPVQVTWLTCLFKCCTQPTQSCYPPPIYLLHCHPPVETLYPATVV